MAFTNIGSAKLEVSGVISGSDTASGVSVPDLGATRVGFVKVAYKGSGSIESVTWNGVSMTPATAQVADTTTLKARIFILDAPAHNGSYDIVVTYSASANHFALITIGWASESNAISLDDTTELNSQSGTSTAVVTVTPTTANQLCLAVSAHSANAIAATPVSGCTLLQNFDSGGDCYQSSYTTPASAGDSTHTHNYSQSGTWCAAAISLKAETTNTTPTIAPNTADGTVFRTRTPAVEFTGSDTEDDDLRYNVQITDNPDGFTGGSELEDNYTVGSLSLLIHPQPLATLTWQGNFQVDDRPGQSFTGNGGILDKIQIYCGPDGTSEDGTAYVRVYGHQGVFGTSSEPRGAVDRLDTPTPAWLAISNGVAITSASAEEWKDFTFTGVNRIRLVEGTKYVLIVDWVPSTSDVQNVIGVAGDATTISHAGNAYIDGYSEANNGVLLTMDINFRVYESYVLLDKVSGTDSGFVNTVTGGDTDPFNAGEKVSFTVQSGDALDWGTTYYWRARVTDPSGTAVYSSWSATRSFSIIAPMVPPSARPTFHTRRRMR